MLWFVHALKSGWATMEGFRGDVNWKSFQFCWGNVGVKMEEGTGIEEACRGISMELVCAAEQKYKLISSHLLCCQIICLKEPSGEFFFLKKEVEISNEEQKPLMWKHSHFCNDEWSGEEGHDLFHFCFCSSWDCQVGFAAWLLCSGAPCSVFYSSLWGKKEYFSFP